MQKRSTLTLLVASALIGCGGAPPNDPQAPPSPPNAGEVTPTEGTITNATPPGGAPGGTVHPNSSAPSTVK